MNNNTEKNNIINVTNMLFSDGTYTGQCKQTWHVWHTPHGKGTMIFANGDIYEGDFKDEKREGQGEMTFVSGDKYVGRWKDGEQNGKGIMTLANGDKYEGYWKDGKLLGKINSQSISNIFNLDYCSYFINHNEKHNENADDKRKICATKPNKNSSLIRL